MNTAVNIKLINDIKLTDDDTTVVVAIKNSGTEILGTMTRDHSKDVGRSAVISVIKQLTKNLGYCLTDISLRKGHYFQ